MDVLPQYMSDVAYNVSSGTVNPSVCITISKIINKNRYEKSAYQYNTEAPEVTWFIVIFGSHLTAWLQCMPEHFRCSIVQRKAWRRQAAIRWLHPCKAKINQSNFGIVSITFIQQVLQDMQFTVNTDFVVNSEYVYLPKKAAQKTKTQKHKLT